MNRASCWLTWLGIPLLLLSPHGVRAQDPDLARRIRACAQPAIDGELTVGMVVGVLTASGPQVFGFGRVSRGDDTVPNGRTVYEIGSISKVFTGLLLADAAQRSEVTLDDPVTDHLPAGIRVPSRGDRPIRLIDLATHTSGLPRMPRDFQPHDANDPYRDYATTSLYASLGKAQLRSQPGKRYAYSNFGAGLLGHVLAHKAGTPYDELVRTRITEPLDMRDTRVSLTPSMKDRLAKPYVADGSPSHPWTFDALAGAGALRSTANDLLTFAAANLRPEETPLADVLLAAQTLRFSGPPQGLGLGWHLGESGSVLWHNGGTGGYRSFLGIHREHGCAVVLLANTTSQTMDVIAHGVLDVLRGKEPAPLEVRKVLPLPEEDLAPYAGTYRLNDTVSFTLSLKDAGLFARLSGQEALRIFPESKERFFYRGVKAEIHFDLDETGVPAALVLHQGGREQRAERVR